MTVLNILTCQPFGPHVSPSVSKAQKVNTVLLKTDTFHCTLSPVDGHSTGFRNTVFNLLRFYISCIFEAPENAPHFKANRLAKDVLSNSIA
jgi:hypothetical protein